MPDPAADRARPSRTVRREPRRVRAAVDAAPHGLHQGRGSRSSPAEDELPVLPGARRCSDDDGLIVARGELVYAVLNLYPYNAGHLMVCPVPARGRLHRPDRGGDRRAGRVHQARDDRAARRVRARRASTSA